MRSLLLLLAVVLFGCSREPADRSQVENAPSAPIQVQPVAAAPDDLQGQQAVVCGIGQSACGARCYEAAKGEKCCPNGKTVCGFGQTCCGERCFDAAKGEKCCPNGTSVCGFGQSCCGDRCYDASRGEKCLP